MSAPDWDARLDRLVWDEGRSFDEASFKAGARAFIESCQRFDLKRPLKLILPTADGGRVAVDPDDGVVLVVAGEEKGEL